MSVAPAAGYIITKVKFYGDSVSAFDETSPFEATLYASKMYVNRSFCGAIGVNKIEVYGYAAPTTYTVTWKNGSTVLETDADVAEGATPEYNGNEPTKPDDDENTYEFAGWNDGTTTYAPDALPAVTGDVTYTATFTAVPKQTTSTEKTFETDTELTNATDANAPYEVGTEVWTINEGVTVTVPKGLAITGELTVQGEGTLIVNGNPGYYGNDGDMGEDSENYGEPGTNGTDGTDGGNGGNGAYAFAGTVTILSGTVYASGGEGGYKYAFYYKKTTSKAFTLIGEEFGDATTATFTPASSTKYNVRINVMDADGNVVTKQYKIVSTAQQAQ